MNIIENKRFHNFIDSYKSNQSEDLLSLFSVNQLQHIELKTTIKVLQPM